jgi:exodeoxyribonuclease VII small subunit
VSEAREDAPGLERRIARIEEIAAALENDRLELQQALALFEEGIAHVRAAEAMLADADLRIERLVEDGRGGVITEPAGDRA